MQLMEDAAFLAWLEEGGITDISGPRGVVWLAFGAAQDCWRTWEAPQSDALPAWLEAVVRAASLEGPWWLWRRGGGGWYGGTAAREEIAAAATLAGVPRDFSGALGFAADERDRVMGIVRGFTAWPWGLSDDFYLVPDDRSCVVMLCHDEEIHVCAADRARLRTFGRVLSATTRNARGRTADPPSTASVRRADRPDQP